MNYKTEITQLRNSSTYRVSLGTKIVVRTPIFRNEKHIDDHFYIFDQKDVLGEGDYAVIYKAFAINKNGDVNLSTPHAAKVFRSSKDFDAQETRIFQAYYLCERPVITEDKVIFISEYFPGHELFDEKQQLSKSFQNLTLSQTCELIYQICLSLNLMHHDTGSTGKALFHCDIKGRNIKVHIDPKSGRINVYVFDFGFSQHLPDESPERTYKAEGKGTPLYAAPEVAFRGIRGIKTDIYALTPIALKACLLKQREYEDFIARQPSPEPNRWSFFIGASKCPYTAAKLLEFVDTGENLKTISTQIPKNNALNELLTSYLSIVDKIGVNNSATKITFRHQ